MARLKRVKIEGFDDVITDLLKSYAGDVREGVDDKAKESIKKLVKTTKATAPVGKRDKHYRDSIKSKGFHTRRTDWYIWYVDGPDYRLSHLLEKGHATRNGGRVEGTHFIQKAADPILEEYFKAVEEVLKNG